MAVAMSVCGFACKRLCFWCVGFEDINVPSLFNDML